MLQRIEYLRLQQLGCFVIYEKETARWRPYAWGAIFFKEIRPQTSNNKAMRTKADCRTQWHVIVAFLHYSMNSGWVPTYMLQSRETEFGFIGSSGEQRVRELAR